MQGIPALPKVAEGFCPSFYLNRHKGHDGKDPTTNYERVAEWVHGVNECRSALKQKYQLGGILRTTYPSQFPLKLFFISVDDSQDSSLLTEQGQLDKSASSASILSPDELVSLQQEIELLGK